MFPMMHAAETVLAYEVVKKGGELAGDLVKDIAAEFFVKKIEHGVEAHFHHEGASAATERSEEVRPYMAFLSRVLHGTTDLVDAHVHRPVRKAKSTVLGLTRPGPFAGCAACPA